MSVKEVVWKRVWEKFKPDIFTEEGKIKRKPMYDTEFVGEMISLAIKLTKELTCKECEKEMKERLFDTNELNDTADRYRKQGRKEGYNKAKQECEKDWYNNPLTKKLNQERIDAIGYWSKKFKKEKKAKQEILRKVSELLTKCLVEGKTPLLGYDKFNHELEKLRKL